VASPEIVLLLGFLLPLVIGGAIVVFVLTTVRKRAGAGAISAGLGMGRSKDDQQEIARLQSQGRHARAHLVGVRPTGVIINQINLGVELSFLLEPLDGSPRFEGTKQSVVSQAQMPRVGDVWPAWYDPADRTKFMVAVATQATPDTVGLYRQFGIPHPLDAMMGTAGGPAGGGPANPPPPPPPPGSPPAPPAPAAQQPVDRVGELERLARLHAEGHLSAWEFQEAKRRLLGG
jgi:hypothetical protein